jgi:hypothetical protein
MSEEEFTNLNVKDIPLHIHLEMQLTTLWLQQIHQQPYSITFPNTDSTSLNKETGNRLSRSIFHHPAPTYCLATGGRVWYDTPKRAQLLCIASKSVDRLLKLELKPSKATITAMTAARPKEHVNAPTQWHLYDWNMYEHTSERHCMRYHPERYYHPYHQTWLSS